MTPEQLAKLFHETYERLAPHHGYVTRKDSAVPWEEVPEGSRSLMIETCAAVLEKIGESAIEADPSAAARLCAVSADPSVAALLGGLRCGHMRQLDAIVDLLGVPHGTRSVLDELRSRLECSHDGNLLATFSGGDVQQAGRVQWCTRCGAVRYEQVARGQWVWNVWMRAGAPPLGSARTP